MRIAVRNDWVGLVLAAVLCVGLVSLVGCKKRSPEQVERFEAGMDGIAVRPLPAMDAEQAEEIIRSNRRDGRGDSDERGLDPSREDAGTDGEVDDGAPGPEAIDSAAEDHEADVGGRGAGERGRAAREPGADRRSRRERPAGPRGRN